MNELEAKYINYAINQIHTAADICNWASSLPFINDTEEASLKRACTALENLKLRLEVDLQ